MTISINLLLKEKKQEERVLINENERERERVQRKEDDTEREEGGWHGGGWNSFFSWTSKVVLTLNEITWGGFPINKVSVYPKLGLYLQEMCKWKLCEFLELQEGK